VVDRGANVALTEGEILPRACRRSRAALGRSTDSIAAAAAHATGGSISTDIHADREYRTAMAAIYTPHVEAALARLR
jgi:hypothetical protein